MTTSRNDDMAIIKERMLASFMRAPDKDRVQDYRQTLQPDGHWAEVNYEGTA
ncbi:MAG: hypothetical protein HN521_08310, partial [Candidatus Latescibacteria bacterium]|nr:hypothetical protein [Candidatus Latescibacterota bacterium]